MSSQTNFKYFNWLEPGMDLCCTKVHTLGVSCVNLLGPCSSHAWPFKSYAIQIEFFL